jgi:hypothetical protein
MISYCAYTTTISSYIHTGKLRISYAYVIAICTIDELYTLHHTWTKTPSMITHK